jgi:hypothetical protein
MRNSLKIGPLGTSQMTLSNNKNLIWLMAHREFVLFHFDIRLSPILRFSFESISYLMKVKVASLNKTRELTRYTYFGGPSSRVKLDITDRDVGDGTWWNIFTIT